MQPHCIVVVAVAAADLGRDTALVHVDGPTLRPSWRHLPDSSRLRPDAPRRVEVIARHDTALERGTPTYADPASGFSVFTADFLASRGYCCESGCRHCPFID